MRTTVTADTGRVADVRWPAPAAFVAQRGLRNVCPLANDVPNLRRAPFSWVSGQSL